MNVTAYKLQKIDEQIKTYRPATYREAKVANMDNMRVEIRDRITIPVNRTLDPLLCICVVFCVFSQLGSLSIRLLSSIQPIQIKNRGLKKKIK